MRFEKHRKKSIASFFSVLADTMNSQREITDTDRTVAKLDVER